ncbi:tyrosine-type recombinase/integrase [Natribaculum luteum]|uniref:Tyrosine-type recombinase/integrase n=1 Tax=Natribaculum luteum TaxID=1586232 RepID=A0ABD5P5M1_9EURY|nr:site-specific integrase [Natribaculum luteum]
MPPQQYRDIEDCRPGLRRYAKRLKSQTDDADDEKNSTSSLTSYLQDVRWFDHWLDDNEFDRPADVSPVDILDLIDDLDNQFNGTTPRYRYDRIHNLYEFLIRADLADENPLEKWRGDHGLSKTTEQSRHLDPGEKRAVTPEEVDLIERNVVRHAKRDRLIVRILWQTGMRRGELAELLLDDIDRSRREVRIRPEVAKNGKPRVVAYHPSLDGYLSRWIDGGDRDALNRNNRETLLVGERGGKVRGERINEIVRDAAIEAGINEVDYVDANGGERWKITAHSLRKGYGTYMANETDMGIWELSKQMGHSSVDITEKRYVDHDERAGVEQAHRFVPE